MPAPILPSITTKLVGHRLGFAIVAVLVLCTLVLLPFAVTGAVGDIFSSPTGRVYRLVPAQQPDPERLLVHLNIVTIDVVQRTATIGAAAHQVCVAACTRSYQVLFVSTVPEGPDDDGVPPTATLAVPVGTQEVTSTITLPVYGSPIRYPFDSYSLGFGIVLQLVNGSATTPLPPDQADGQVIVTLQTHVQGLDMADPLTLGADRVPVVGAEYPFLTVREVRFDRPLYLKVLTTLLVLLVASAASFAVFMRPLDQLVINAGALVIGIWGVRSILVGTNGPPFSAVDLSLSLVILFLLAAIAVRSFSFLDERSGARVLRVLRRPADDVPPAPATTPAASASLAYVPGSTADTGTSPVVESDVRPSVPTPTAGRGGA